MRKILLATAALLASVPAFAADMVTKAPPLLPVPYCTLASCTGFYVGGGIAGNGTNADIVGNGISGSVFSGGGIPFADAGWQLWNGTTMLDFEVGGGYQINVGTAVQSGGASTTSNETGYDFYQEMQLGGNLSNLISPAPAPVTPPSGLLSSMMFPYVSFGVDERPFATGWRTGAGAKFLIAKNVLLDIGYRYINYGSATIGTPTNNINFNAENLVFLKFNWML